MECGRKGELNPSVLRHSLNTHLRLFGVYDVLVVDYMCWEWG